MLIDIHTHNFRNEHTEVVVLDPRNIPKDSPALYCIGIHPWYIDNFQHPKKFIEETINNQNLFALGEIGVDKAISIDLSKQLEYFELQMQLAVKNNISRVVIHCVRAFEEVTRVIKMTKYTGKVLFHDYNSTLQMSEYLLKQFDCYFSFGKSLFRENSKTSKLIKLLPIKRIFLETDDQDEYRINQIYLYAASFLNMEVANLESQLEINFQEFSK